MVHALIWPAIAILLVVFGVPAFLKARDDARAGACVSNMRLIDHAKEVVAIQRKLQPGATLNWKDLDPYIDSETPVPMKCPSGGNYILNPVDEPPSCSLGGRHIYVPAGD